MSGLSLLMSYSPFHGLPDRDSLALTCQAGNSCQTWKLVMVYPLAQMPVLCMIVSESDGGALMTFFILLVDSPAAIETLQEYQDSSRR